MSEENLPLPRLSFASLPDNYSGPSDGNGLVNLGFDGAVPILVKEAKPEAKRRNNKIIGQVALVGETCDMEGTDANGNPLNGQELRAWEEYAGEDKKGNSLSWKFFHLLVSAGIYTAEQLREAKERESRGEDLGIDIAAMAQHLVGRKVYYVLTSKVMDNGAIASQLDTAITAERYQKMMETMTADGVPQARRKQVPYDKNQAKANQNPVASVAGISGATTPPPPPPAMGGAPGGFPAPQAPTGFPAPAAPPAGVPAAPAPSAPPQQPGIPPMGGAPGGLPGSFPG